MAYSPSWGYIDPFGGLQDLQEHVLQTVGDPEQRFSEDALRILRGVRFAMRFQLTPHPDTEAAMLSTSDSMEQLARERVFSELCKLLPYATAADLLRYAPIFCQIIPELTPCLGFDQQNPHHRYDIYTHTAHVVEAAPAELPVRLAALLHDIGKPATFTLDENGIGHFHGHAEVSAAMADEILQRLKAPNALRQQVVTLIEQHMNPLTADETLLRRRLSRLGAEPLKQLASLQQADGWEDSEGVLPLIDALISENSCLHIRDLAIDGHDLIAIGFEPGPRLGEVLNALLSQVIDNTIPNEKAALLEAAEAMKEESQ
jgi:tRNA nucleotidyltransferase (CCA-adding enzyme)